MPRKPQEKIAQNPLILRAHRLMEAFAKSDDERDFYLDHTEGFMIYVDLDKSQEELDALELELLKNADRYRLIPKLTFYETKKIMEGFINEKVYDIDTKEKLMDIIQSKEARENFLEFIYDHLPELEKWQQYYQERSRIRIIEWLRLNEFVFVFEEDLDLTKNVIEKLKKLVFETTVPKDIANARKVLASKAKTYYSNEALNPRPKRGRPPKQTAKVEIEPQITMDHYQTLPSDAQPFLFNPDITHPSAVTFSAKFDSKDELMASLKNSAPSEHERTLENLNQRLASLRKISRKVMGEEESAKLRASLQPVATDKPAPTRRKATPASIRPAKTSAAESTDDQEEAPKPRRGRPPKKKEGETDTKPRAKRRIIRKKVD